jgi:hypothetical protein
MKNPTPLDHNKMLKWYNPSNERGEGKGSSRTDDRKIMTNMMNYENKFKATILSLKEARLALEREEPPRVDKEKQSVREQSKRQIVDEISPLSTAYS